MWYLLNGNQEASGAWMAHAPFVFSGAARRERQHMFTSSFHQRIKQQARLFLFTNIYRPCTGEKERQEQKRSADIHTSRCYRNCDR